MSASQRDGVARAVRSWSQGLAVAVLIAVWPMLAPLVTGERGGSVDWSSTSHDLRLVAGVAVSSYVQRTVIDPARERRKVKRWAGPLTVDE